MVLMLLSFKKNISLPMKWLVINDFITLLTNCREQCLLQVKVEFLNLLRQVHYVKASLK